MDPESLGALGYNIPCKDGSSHKAMAHSLRELLKQEYKIAIGVHFNGMPREDFRNSVDMAWNWLDQKSLKLSWISVKRDFFTYLSYENDPNIDEFTAMVLIINQ